jgi:ribonuclease E
VIDRTEAMTVVDVNTGKFTGSGGNLEQTVTKNNLEAAEEMVRQLRLRDIGGIIVIDFIDMVLETNRDLVLRRLVECLGRDRTRHQVAEVTSLGLVQMTRKRIGTGLVEAFSVPCDVCHGRGVVIEAEPVKSRSEEQHQPGQGSSSKRSGRSRSGKSEAASAAADRLAAERLDAEKHSAAAAATAAIAAALHPESRTTTAEVELPAAPDPTVDGHRADPAAGHDQPADGPAPKATSRRKSTAGSAPKGSTKKASTAKKASAKKASSPKNAGSTKKSASTKEAASAQQAASR